MSNPNAWNQPPEFGAQQPYGAPGQQPYGAPPYGPGFEQPKSSSGCWRAFLVLLVIGALSLVCCCGVGFWFSTTLTPVTTVAEVTKVRQQILDVELPAGFEPKFGWDVWVIQGRMVIYQRGADKGIAVMGALPKWIFDKNPQAVEEFDRQRNRQSGNRDEDAMEMEEIEAPVETEKKVTIDGKEVDFKIQTGKGRKSQRDLRSVTGRFWAGEQMVFFTIHGEEAQLDDATIDAMLNSIKPAAAK